MESQLFGILGSIRHPFQQNKPNFKTLRRLCFLQQYFHLTLHLTALHHHHFSYIRHHSLPQYLLLVPQTHLLHRITHHKRKQLLVVVVPVQTCHQVLLFRHLHSLHLNLLHPQSQLIHHSPNEPLQLPSHHSLSPHPRILLHILLIVVLHAWSFIHHKLPLTFPPHAHQQHAVVPVEDEQRVVLAKHTTPHPLPRPSRLQDMMLGVHQGQCVQQAPELGVDVCHDGQVLSLSACV